MASSFPAALKGRIDGCNRHDVTAQKKTPCIAGAVHRCPQLFVNPVVVAFAEQALILGGENKVLQGIEIDDLARAAVGVEHPQPVAAGNGRQARFEQTRRIQHAHLVDKVRGLLRQDVDGGRPRLHRADHRSRRGNGLHRNGRRCASAGLNHVDRVSAGRGRVNRCGGGRRCCCCDIVRAEDGERILMPAIDDAGNVPVGQTGRGRVANDQPQAWKARIHILGQRLQQARAIGIGGKGVDVVALQPED